VTATITGLDVARIRKDFPILRETVRGRPLVYLDNAATSQKPAQVLAAVKAFYEHENANVHRGVHYLSERATALYEAARAKAQAFLNARDPSEIIFVRGTTEAINLVAGTFGRQSVRQGDEIVVSAMEHHSNIVPWQMLCQERGARLRVIPMSQSGDLLLDEYERLLSPRVRLVAVAHVSNSLGTINPIKDIIAAAHARTIPVLVDGAQAAPHGPIDVQALNADFYAISGHKMFAPTGIGVLFGRAELLDAMPPYQGGGDMIRSVTFERTTYAASPAKFEAGTPNIGGAIGLGAAIDYLGQLDWAAVAGHEAQLLAAANEGLSSIRGVRLIGTSKHKASVVSFVMDGAHAHDVGTIVDQAGVAIRTGHHCTQPVMDLLGVPATARASFAFYNTLEDVDSLVHAVREVREVFS
jgi:cysteine desulfurase/selenocysteine lyase